MLPFEFSRSMSGPHFNVPWLKSELAFFRALVALRWMRQCVVKFDTNQPRVPAGQTGGGQWSDGGGGSTPASGLGVQQQLFADQTGTAPFDYFANTYADSGALAAQLVGNRDGTVTTTEWDTGGVENWAVRQKWNGADKSIITTTQLSRDGTGQITFGRGAEGQVVLTSADGRLALVPPGLAVEGTVAFQATEGEIVNPLTDSVVRVIGTGGAAAGGAFIVGMTAFSTSANPIAITPLSDDVRLRFTEEQQPPEIQVRIDGGLADIVTGSSWRTLPDVPVALGPAHTVIVDAGQLRDAIGSQKFDAIGNPDGLGVWLSMQAAPVAPADVPPGSIFAGSGRSVALFSPQGTVVDWSAPYAQAELGQATVLELTKPSIRGLSWTSGDDKPMIGNLDVGDVDRFCPRFTDVHQVAVEADIRVRAANPGLDPRALGTLIHDELRSQVKSWPEIGVGLWSEQGLLLGVEQNLAVLPRGASRIDVLEDAGQGVVCVYDAKTGVKDMSSRTMIRYWQEALDFRKGTKRIFVIPLHTNLGR